MNRNGPTGHLGRRAAKHAGKRDSNTRLFALERALVYKSPAASIDVSVKGSHWRRDSAHCRIVQVIYRKTEKEQQSTRIYLNPIHNDQ